MSVEPPVTADPAFFRDTLRAAQEGSQHAIAELFTAHDPVLRRYLEGRARGAGEDLAQEVWIAAARNLRTFAGDEAGFRAWLFSIARNKLVDHVRHHARRPVAPTDPQALATSSPAFEVEDRLTAEEAIAELVADLRPEEADIILLRVVGGLPVEEVARLVGKSPGAVRVAQHRALRRVAERLQDPAVTR